MYIYICICICMNTDVCICIIMYIHMHMKHENVKLCDSLYENEGNICPLLSRRDFQDARPS